MLALAMSNANQQDGATGIAAGTVIDGRYKVVRCIGQGGSGLVHEVEHVRTGRRLALKSLHDEKAGLGRLEQEARATSLMTNSHAAKITDMGTTPETGPYLVMELLTGQSLRALLDEAGQLPLELMVNIALQVCECLEEAHRHGIVHRDLKPENVFLCASPWPGQHDVKVLDFGVVKIASDGPIPNASLTRTGSTVGTPYYMSLEQLRNSSAVDARADVYALGVVLYESLSGRKPFQADTIGDLVYALCSGPPTHLGRLRPDLPAELTEMIMKALSANRDERPKSMMDFAAALLPHGNAAFGLWVKVDGKQPALARPGVSTTATLTPGMIAKPALPAPPPAAPGIPRPAAKTEATPAAPRPAAGAAPKPLWSEGAAPAPPTAPAAAADAKPEAGGRRDTPTEMYTKDAHGSLAPAGEASSSGDRDTPTRAIPAAVLEEQQRRRNPALQTLKAQFAPDEPTGRLPELDEQLRQASALGAHDLGIMQTVPAVAVPQLGLPLDGAPPAMPLATMPLATAQVPFDSPFKPGWQRALDGALRGLGRTVDGLGAKFRDAPKQTRILIVVCIASVLLLVVLTIVLLSM